MKNKKLNKILLPLVVLIWLAVMFRFFGSASDDSNLPVKQNADLSLFAEEQKKDSFSLHLSYRDPFLDRPADLGLEKTRVPSSSSRTIPALRLEKITHMPSIKYPEVKYLGGIQRENDIRGLVQIDGRISQVKHGEEMDGVKILKLNLKEIHIQFKDSSWTVRKNP